MQRITFQVPRGKYVVNLATSISIQEANKNRAYVLCRTLAERDRIAKLAHQASITHITAGKKDYNDYTSRVKKGVYSEEHLYVSFYGSEFFAILDESPRTTSPHILISSTSIK